MEDLIKYEVKHGINGKTTIYAKSATDAKKKVCKMYDIKQNDCWCGISNMTAKKI